MIAALVFAVLLLKMMGRRVADPPRAPHWAVTDAARLLASIGHPAWTAEPTTAAMARLAVHQEIGQARADMFIGHVLRRLVAREPQAPGVVRVAAMWQPTPQLVAS